MLSGILFGGVCVIGMMTPGYAEEFYIPGGPWKGGGALLNEPFMLEDLAREVRLAIDNCRR